MKVNYNAHGDVLYISMKDTNKPCVYVESDAGPVFRIEKDTELVVGITIPFFMRRMKQAEGINVRELGVDLSGHQLLAMMSK